MVTEPTPDGDQCPSDVDYRACEDMTCPVDCAYRTLDPVCVPQPGVPFCTGADTVAQGTYNGSPSIEVIVPAQRGGKECPQIAYNWDRCEIPCPDVDCVMGDWSEWMGACDMDTVCSRMLCAGFIWRCRPFLCPFPFADDSLSPSPSLFFGFRFLILGRGYRF